MMHTKDQKEFARNLYIQQHKTIDQIAVLTGVSSRTLHRWCKQDDWIGKMQQGSLDLAVKIDLKIRSIVETAIEDDSIEDPRVADKLAKLQKIADRLRPERQLLGNIFTFLEATTHFILMLEKPELTEAWQKHLNELSNYLAGKFSKGD